MLEETQEREEIIQRVAALDIGKAELVCCARVPSSDTRGRRSQEVQTYSTMTRSLLVMSDRLRELGVTRVVMEATSDYWKPPLYLLEAQGLQVWLVNERRSSAARAAQDRQAGRGVAVQAKVLAQMARGRLRAKLAVLDEAFTGYFTDHHAFLLAKMLHRVDQISADVGELEAEIAPFARAVDRLDEIPGVGRTAAHVLVSEIGLDMERFPTPGT